MNRLTLMRHAKSDWADRSLSDSARPLNNRGRAAAPLIGAFMHENDLTPDLVLCSSSQRTRETLDLLLPHFKPAPETSISERLYLASPAEILGQIQAADDARTHILMIGHNPGTHMLAQELIDPKRSDNAAVAQLAGKFPTAALAHFEFDLSAWRQVDRRRGALVYFKTPKMLGPPAQPA